jgi:EmrB/QacA subfamily drug resistance transporter
MATLMLVPLVAAAALFMENLDATVIATSLPAIARDLHQDPVILKLAFTSYLIALAVFIPVSGWAADRFGARNVFRGAIVIFTLASAACGFADSLEWLVAARAVQGIGGAMMTPVGRLILLRSVPRSELVQALAYLTIPALIAPLIGPLVGGFITTYFHWRWIFWINIPVGVLGLVLASRYMPDVRADRVPPLDWLGFCLSGLGLSAIIFGFTITGGVVLPRLAAPALVMAGAVLVALYIHHARRAPHPILDLRLFRIPTFRSSLVGGTVFRVGIGSIPFLLPLMLQVGFGLNPFESGSLTFAAAAGALVMKITALPILRQFGFRRVLVVNALICGGFLAINGLFTPHTPHAAILLVLLTGGFFRSLQFTSLNALAFADVPAPILSQATSMSAVAQQLASAAGVALAAFLLESARALRGDNSLVTADFSIAFITIAVFTAFSGWLHLSLEKDAGAEVAGTARE